jgi:hypothetical protein
MLVYFTVIWSILRSFGLFYGHLVMLWYFGIFFLVLVHCAKKNLATLLYIGGVTRQEHENPAVQSDASFHLWKFVGKSPIRAIGSPSKFQLLAEAVNILKGLDRVRLNRRRRNMKRQKNLEPILQLRVTTQQIALCVFRIKIMTI